MMMKDGATIATDTPNIDVPTQDTNETHPAIGKDAKCASGSVLDLQDNNIPPPFTINPHPSIIPVLLKLGTWSKVRKYFKFLGITKGEGSQILHVLGIHDQIKPE